MRSILLAFIFSQIVSFTFAQPQIQTAIIQHQGKSEKVISIYHEIEINTTSEYAWDQIAIEFANIGDYHPMMDYSYSIDKSLRYGLHAIRHCQIDDEQFIQEQIINWSDKNKTFTYRLFKQSGTPFILKSGQFQIISKNGKTYISHKLDYRFKSFRKTKCYQRKMLKENANLLRVIRYHLEVNDYAKPPLEELEKKYKM